MKIITLLMGMAMWTGVCLYLGWDLKYNLMAFFIGWLMFERMRRE